MLEGQLDGNHDEREGLLTLHDLVVINIIFR